MHLLTRIIFATLVLSISQFTYASPAQKTVETLHQEMSALSGKQIQVKGKVVKVNNGIMNRNFLHIQDGTGNDGSNDLIVTSQQTANIGDEVMVTGTVVTDTDFGFGYAYPLLVEKATIEAVK